MVHTIHDINEVKKMVLIGADCESSFDQVKEKHSGLICVQKRFTFSLMITMELDGS